MEPLYPNLLLEANSSMAWSLIVVTAIALIFILPASCLILKKKKEQILNFNPGQERLIRVFGIEAIVFALTLVFYICSMSSNNNTYTFQTIAFYFFFAGIHIVMLMLQNTLAIAETK